MISSRYARSFSFVYVQPNSIAVPFVFRHAMRISLVLVNFPGREMVVILKCASGKKFSILDQHNDSSGRDVIRHVNCVIDLSSNPNPSAKRENKDPQNCQLCVADFFSMGV